MKINSEPTRRQLMDQVAEYKSENDRLRRNLKAELADHMNGTPCAAIRWQHEKEELEAEIERLREKIGRYKPVLLDLVNQYPEEGDIDEYWFYRAKKALQIKDSE